MKRQALAALALLWSLCASAQSEAPPNILLILLDDVGWSDLGSYGSEIPTPNIDQIAAQGLQLTNFHTADMCAPTRAMLMTGIDHHRVGIGTLPELTWGLDAPPGYEGNLRDDTVTIATLLQDSGYQTWFAGKWHLGYDEAANPAARGFDRSFAMMGSGASHFADMHGMWAREPRMAYTEDGQPVESLPADFYSTNYYTDRMIGYLEQRDERPFFAYLAPTALHFPLQVPDPWLEKWQGAYSEGYEEIRQARFQRQQELFGGRVNLPDQLRPPEVGVTPWEELSEEERLEQQRFMQIYAAMLDNLDWNIGRLLDYLQRTDELNNTLIILLSDNGPDPTALQGPFQEWSQQYDQSLDNLGRINSYVQYGPGWAQAGSTPWRHFKHYTSVGGVRVPALVLDPRVDQPDLSDAFVHVSDLAATLLDYAGVRVPEGDYLGRPIQTMQGKSARSLFEGKLESLHDEQAVFGWEMRGVRAVQQGDWRATWFPVPRGDAQWHLFNIADDPSESHDLRDIHPEKLQQMISLWNEYASENRVATEFTP